MTGEKNIMIASIPFTTDTQTHTHIYMINEEGIKWLTSCHRQKVYNFSCYYLLEFERENRENALKILLLSLLSKFKKELISLGPHLKSIIMFSVQIQRIH